MWQTAILALTVTDPLDTFILRPFLTDFIRSLVDTYACSGRLIYGFYFTKSVQLSLHKDSTCPSSIAEDTI